MDPLEALEKLAAEARKETPPVGSVRGRVLAKIRTPRGSPLLPLTVLAAGSALAASALLAVGMHFLRAARDPLVELFTPLQVPLPW